MRSFVPNAVGFSPAKVALDHVHLRFAAVAQDAEADIQPGDRHQIEVEAADPPPWIFQGGPAMVHQPPVGRVTAGDGGPLGGAANT